MTMLVDEMMIHMLAIIARKGGRGRGGEQAGGGKHETQGRLHTAESKETSLFFPSPDFYYKY